MSNSHNAASDSPRATEVQMRHGRESSQARFQVILFGTFECDGRAQRLVHVLRDLGGVKVISVPETATIDLGAPEGVRRITLRVGKQESHLRRFLRLIIANLLEGVQDRPTVVVACNFFALPIAWLVSRISRARLIYDAYELIITDKSQPVSLTMRAWQLLEKYIAPRTQLVLAANRERAEIMKTCYRLLPAPIVVRNIPKQESPLYSRPQIEERFPPLKRTNSQTRLVLYQGRIDKSRRVDRYIEALCHLPDEYRLVLVGEGPLVDELMLNGVGGSTSGHIVYLGRLPQNVLSSVTQVADVGLISYPTRGLNNHFCAPNKIYEYAQARVPVVTSDQPWLQHVVKHFDLGVCVGEAATGEAIAKAIRAACNMDPKVFGDGVNRFLSEHSFEDDRRLTADAIRNLLL